MELKPCPICKSQPQTWLDNDSLNPQREGLNIECNSGQHLVRVYAVGSDVAAKIWNTRPVEEDLLKRIAELEKENKELEIENSKLKKSNQAVELLYERRITNELLRQQNIFIKNIANRFGCDLD